MHSPAPGLRRPSVAGAITALVTPMDPAGKIDWPSLDRLVDTQIDAGIAALCACGTTAEAATMALEEREAVVARVVRAARGRVPVIAGTGNCATAVTIDAQKRAQALGADYGLVVTPYYNKPTPRGLVLHYEAVAAACTLPIIMYNVPSRTGCDMQPDTIRVLAQNPRIVGIKEATGDLGRLDRLRGCVPADFALLSGDDGSSCAFVLMGGDGVISVTSNCAPNLMAQLMAHASKGELDAARALQTRLLPLFDVLFAESNPIVVKAAMALQGQIEAHVRLPLCSLSPAVHERLQGVIEDGLFT